MPSSATTARLPSCPALLRLVNVRFGYIATWQSYRMALHVGRSLGRLRRALKREASTGAS